MPLGQLPGWYTRVVPSSERPRRTSAVVLAIGFLSIGLYCFLVTRHRILWSDELFGWKLVTDPGWRHMLLAWREGADGGGAGFYILCRFWLRLFGQTALSLRAFSAAACFAGFAATWFVLRRFYPTRIAVFTLFAVWFGSYTVLWQMVQTRFYGLLLGAAAYALLAAVRSADDAGLGPQRGSTLALAAIANTVLVEAHPFGVLHSAAILIGSAIADVRGGRRRIRFYLAAALPWSLLLFSREAMENSAAVGRPWFWTARPGLHELALMYLPDGVHNRVELGAFALVLCVSFLVCKPRLAVSRGSRGALLLPAAALALMPPFVWLASQRGTSIFVDRYMISFTLGVAVWMAEALTQLYGAEPARRARLAFACLAGLTFLCLGWDAIWRYPRHLVFPPSDFTPALAAKLPAGVPVVFEDAGLFVMMLHQQQRQLESGAAGPWLYLLDWPAATAPDAPRSAVSAYHEMGNWLRVGYAPGLILPSQDFLNATPRFAVVDCNCSPAFDRRILLRPGWHATRVSGFRTLGWAESIWLVERDGGAQPAQTRDLRALPPGQ